MMKNTFVHYVTIDHRTNIVKYNQSTVTFDEFDKETTQIGKISYV